MRREDNGKTLKVTVRVSVYCNVPSEGGYDVYGNQVNFHDLDRLDRVEGEGFLVSIRSSGGTAILAEREVSGGRESQKNVLAVWEDRIPLEYLPSLKKALRELDYTQTGVCEISLHAACLPKPSARLIAGMRASLAEGSCSIVREGSGRTAVDILAAANCLVLPDNRLSLALPLPARASHQDINLYPPGFEAKNSPDKSIFLSRQVWRPDEITKDDRDLARCMAEASPQIVNLAKNLQSERVYQLFIALLHHTILTPEPDDDDLLEKIFDRMDEQDLDILFLALHSRKEKIQVLQSELYASTDEEEEGEETIPLSDRLRGFFSAIGRGMSRFAHSRKVHFVFCLLLTVLLLGFCSMDLTPETVILFEDGSELVSAVLALVWGIFFGGAFGRRNHRRSRNWGREEWEEDSGE